MGYSGVWHHFNSEGGVLTWSLLISGWKSSTSCSCCFWDIKFQVLALLIHHFAKPVWSTVLHFWSAVSQGSCDLKVMAFLLAQGPVVLWNTSINTAAKVGCSDEHWQASEPPRLCLSPQQSQTQQYLCAKLRGIYFFSLDFRPAKSNNLYFDLLHIFLKHKACQILRNERKWDNLTPELTWACLLSFLSILPSHVLCGSPFTLTKETTDVSFLFLEYMTPLEQLCHLSCQIFSSAQYVRLFRKMTRFLILAA